LLEQIIQFGKKVLQFNVVAQLSWKIIYEITYKPNLKLLKFPTF